MQCSSSTGLCWGGRLTAASNRQHRELHAACPHIALQILACPPLPYDSSGRESMGVRLTKSTPKGVNTTHSFGRSTPLSKLGLDHDQAQPIGGPHGEKDTNSPRVWAPRPLSDPWLRQLRLGAIPIDDWHLRGPDWAQQAFRYGKSAGRQGVCAPRPLRGRITAGGSWLAFELLPSSCSMRSIASRAGTDGLTE